MSNEGMKTLYSDPAIRFHPEVGTVENLNAELAFTKATNRLKDAVEIHREGFVTPKANFKYNGNEFELLQSSLKEAKVEFARVAEFEKVRGVYKYSNQQAFKDITKTLDEVIVDAAKVTEDGALMSKNLSKWGRIGRLGYAAVILGVAVTVGSIYVQTESKGMSATDRAASKTDFMGFVIGLPKEQVKKYGLEECYDQYSYMLDLAHKHPEVADEWVKEAVAAAEKMDEENQRNKKLQKSLQSYQDKINIDADPLFPKQST